MKKLFSLISIMTFCILTFAQSPQKMSYQSVIRNGADQLVTESTVGIQISILQGSAVGTSAYVETHAPMTNINGLAALEIGMGTPVVGTFASVDWSSGPYFIRTDTDPLGGSSYILTGTTELLSVPYALYAANAGSWTVTTDAVHTDLRVGLGIETPSAKLHVLDEDGTSLASIYGQNTFLGTSDKYGVRGYSINAPGYGYGGYFEGGYRGIRAIANSSTFPGTTYGVFGDATGTAGSRRGVFGRAYNSGGLTAYGVYGDGANAATNFGIYGTASGGTTNWAGYFQGKVRVTSSSGTETEDSFAQLHVFDQGGINSLIYGQSNYLGETDKVGVRGESINAPGYGIGGMFTGGYRGIVSTATSTTYNGTTTGVYGNSTGSAGNRRGVYGRAVNNGGVEAIGVYGYANGATSNYGVYGFGSGGTTNWAGYFAGNVRITGTLDNTSDAKLKRSIEDLENALDIINQLEPKTYEFRTDEYPQMGLDKRPQLGFIAQDMEQVLPQLVRTAIHPGHKIDGREESNIPESPDVDVKSINYIGIIPVLTQGIKELASEVEEKDKLIEELTDRMDQFERELQSLRK